MTVWIVVSILVVVLSPLAWLRPSRHQSGRMALHATGTSGVAALAQAGAAEPLRAVPPAATWPYARHLELLAAGAGCVGQSVAGGVRR